MVFGYFERNGKIINSRGDIEPTSDAIRSAAMWRGARLAEHPGVNGPSGIRFVNVDPICGPSKVDEK